MPKLQSPVQQKSLAKQIQRYRQQGSETFNRLGTDEYFNVVVDLCSHDQTVEIEERDILERSYEDYLEGSESVIVKGRLRVNVDFWGKHWLLSSLSSALLRMVIRYRFYYTPTPVILRNNKSALQNSDFVLSAITELLKVGSVVEWVFPLVVVNPLSVSIQPNGKKRLILDLRHVKFLLSRSLRLSLKMRNRSSPVFDSQALRLGVLGLISNRVIIILRFLNPINNFWVMRGFLRPLLSISNLRFYRFGLSVSPYIFFPKL